VIPGNDSFCVQPVKRDNQPFSLLSLVFSCVFRVKLLFGLSLGQWQRKEDFMAAVVASVTAVIFTE
jgi:hypothetical protein